MLLTKFYFCANVLDVARYFHSTPEVTKITKKGEMKTTLRAVAQEAIGYYFSSVKQKMKLKKKK